MPWLISIAWWCGDWCEPWDIICWRDSIKTEVFPQPSINAIPHGVSGVHDETKYRKIPLTA